MVFRNMTVPNKLFPRCLAIIFEYKETGIVENAGSILPENGYHLFSAFIQCNLERSQALAETLNLVEYIGHLIPHTLLITGKYSILRMFSVTWAKRLFKAPPGYHIVTVCSVPEVCVNPITHHQAVSLPEALYAAISDMSVEGVPAQLALIRCKLAQTFPGINIPPESVIYNTLDNMIRDGHVFYSGSSYHVTRNEGSCLFPPNECNQQCFSTCPPVTVSSTEPNGWFQNCIGVSQHYNGRAGDLSSVTGYLEPVMRRALSFGKERKGSHLTEWGDFTEPTQFGSPNPATEAKASPKNCKKSIMNKLFGRSYSKSSPPLSSSRSPSPATAGKSSQQRVHKVRTWHNIGKIPRAEARPANLQIKTDYLPRQVIDQPIDNFEGILLHKDGRSYSRSSPKAASSRQYRSPSERPLVGQSSPPTHARSSYMPKEQAQVASPRMGVRSKFGPFSPTSSAHVMLLPHQSPITPHPLDASVIATHGSSAESDNDEKPAFSGKAHAIMPTPSHVDERKQSSNESQMTPRQTHKHRRKHRRHRSTPERSSSTHKLKDYNTSVALSELPPDRLYEDNANTPVERRRFEKEMSRVTEIPAVEINGTSRHHLEDSKPPSYINAKRSLALMNRSRTPDSTAVPSVNLRVTEIRRARSTETLDDEHTYFEISDFSADPRNCCTSNPMKEWQPPPSTMLCSNVSNKKSQTEQSEISGLYTPPAINNTHANRITAMKDADTSLLTNDSNLQPRGHLESASGSASSARSPCSPDSRGTYDSGLSLEDPGIERSLCRPQQGILQDDILPRPKVFARDYSKKNCSSTIV